MNNILQVEHLKKEYGSKSNLTRAIDDISFSLNKGEFVGIMGTSGSGKTTLLNCISTIDNPTSGEIKINGNNILSFKGDKLSEFRQKNLGFIFQHFNLLDTLTGFENIALALTISSYPHNKIKERVYQISKELNIKEVLSKYPYQMSGGEQQRVAAARAIVNDPALILADEPTGALDSVSTKMLLEILDDLNKRLKATILLVTHDNMTASYCHRILFIKDGKIYKELLRNNEPQDTFLYKIIEIAEGLGGDIKHVH